jgi:hypothetical protein
VHEGECWQVKTTAGQLIGPNRKLMSLSRARLKLTPWAGLNAWPSFYASTEIPAGPFDSFTGFRVETSSNTYEFSSFPDARATHA